MASGKTHLTVNRVLLPWVAIGSAAVAALRGTNLLTALLGAGLGMYIGQWVEPDLDLANRTESEHRAITANPLLRLWVWYWIPYGHIFSHRGISHVPVLGTATRLFYLSPLLLVFWFCLSCPTPSGWFGWIVFGMILADILHWLLDMCPTNFRL